ncbi:alpha/beta-hydrolase [Pholiota conissans]|uniref:Alpha/beta-hydrolase n=1 Tax=Pholiota conissans TaxID=109636 RepID=A0A9P5YMK3_9AGAR|nr:alpha/beta-hydrolase [Pholiota conissans]
MATVISTPLSLKPHGSSSPFHILANKYSTKQSESNVDGLTLVFLHAVGLHRETWEVTIQKLLDLDQPSSAHKSIIRDTFSIEIPNHGESALLNENAIAAQFSDSWPTRIIAESTHQFLTAGPGQGAGVNFADRKIVGIGHSIGAAALFLMRDIEPAVRFHAIIAIEPGISIKEHPATFKSSQMLTAWTWLRRDVWPTRKAAKKDLESSPVHSMWDPKVLDLFIKYGLRTHSAAKYKAPFAFAGVTTCASKAQEAACYRSEHLVVDAMNAYTLRTQELPVHIIFGKIHDVGPAELQDILSDKSACRYPASVSYIEGAGHLAVQQRPESVASCISSILVGLNTKVAGRL